MRNIPIIMLFFVVLSTATAFAMESAPRISDREIIESLAEMRTTQKAILQRFEQIDKQFEMVDKRFEQVDKRFEQVDKRFDEMSASNRMFQGFIISILLTLFGYIIWDRRTRPPMARITG